MAQANPALPAEYSDEVIPVLDFRPYLAGEDGALDRLADELRHRFWNRFVQRRAVDERSPRAALAC